MSNFEGDFYHFLRHFSYNVKTTESNNSVNFQDKSMKLDFVPRFSGAIFHIKGLSVMLDHQLAISRGNPTPHVCDEATMH